MSSQLLVISSRAVKQDGTVTSWQVVAKRIATISKLETYQFPKGSSSDWMANMHAFHHSMVRLIYGGTVSKPHINEIALLIEWQSKSQIIRPLFPSPNITVTA